jgi:hypothetical protein
MAAELKVPRWKRAVDSWGPRSLCTLQLPEEFDTLRQLSCGAKGEFLSWLKKAK